ncbi:hypothetical protein QQ045_007727 [Rhodiola kirilowii]
MEGWTQVSNRRSRKSRQLEVAGNQPNQISRTEDLPNEVGTHPRIGDDQLSPILLDTRDSGPSFLTTGTPSPMMLLEKSTIPILATGMASLTIQGDEAGHAVNPHSGIAADLPTHGTSEPNGEVMNSTGKLSMVLEHRQVVDPNVPGRTDGKTCTEVINEDIESSDLKISEEFAQKISSYGSELFDCEGMYGPAKARAIYLHFRTG